MDGIGNRAFVENTPFSDRVKAKLPSKLRVGVGCVTHSSALVVGAVTALGLTLAIFLNVGKIKAGAIAVKNAVLHGADAAISAMQKGLGKLRIWA